MTTFFIRPLLYGASYQAFECCCCSTVDKHGKPMDTPLYASVSVCEKCGDLACADHREGRLCYGCWREAELL